MEKYTRYNKQFGAFLLVLAFATGCASEGSTKIEDETVVVETAVVNEQVAKYALTLPGEVEPYEQVKLYPKVKGFVQDLYVDRGSLVKKGQLLARLDAPEITQAYMAATAKRREVFEKLQFSKQRLERLERASKNEGSVAAIELEQAQAGVLGDSAVYHAVNAEMVAAEELMDYLEIRAPFDGIITDKNVSPGALVGANDIPVFTLAQQDRLRLILAIPSKHSANLGDHTEISYRLNDFPGEAFSARISRSSGVMDKALRSLMIEFDIDNKEGKFKGGEHIQVEVPFERSKETLWVPSSSVVNVPLGIFVLKVEDNSIRWAEVKTGVSMGDMTEVFGELQPKDVIVKNGSEELREGIKIHTN